jgi:hypothetical protein
MEKADDTEEETGKSTPVIHRSQGTRHLRKECRRDNVGKIWWQRGWEKLAKTSCTRPMLESKKSQMGLANESVRATAEK